MIKICDKQSSHIAKREQEDLWKHALKNIYSVKKRVQDLLASNKFGDSDSDFEEGTEERENFRRFCNLRNQVFIRRMSEYVNLN